MESRKKAKSASVPKAKEKPAKTSACTIYEQLLMSPPVMNKIVADGVSVGVGAGNMGSIGAVSVDLKTYDQNTNALLRSYFACQKNMVVSPLSTKQDIHYTTQELHDAELEEAEQMRRKPGGCAIM